MAVKTIGNMSLDALFADGAISAQTKVVELAAGTGSLSRGQLIGVADGTFGAISEANEAYGILAEDVTLGEGAVSALVYVTGHFNGNQVTGYVEATHYEVLRDKGIIVDKALAY